ncbi:hypothetical protein TI39_contig425g00001, partial [Zymoseptoria brevis]
PFVRLRMATVDDETHRPVESAIRPGLRKMIQEARTNDFTTISSTEDGVRAVAKWFLRQDILTQSSAASKISFERHSNNDAEGTKRRL